MYKQTRKCYKTNTRARSAAGYLPPSRSTPALSELGSDQRHDGSTGGRNVSGGGARVNGEGSGD